MYWQYFLPAEKQKQQNFATEFLQSEMGHNVNRASRDKIPVNLKKEEIQLYIKRFQIIDKDRKGYVSINDIRRSLKVSKHHNSTKNVLQSFWMFSVNGHRS